MAFRRRRFRRRFGGRGVKRKEPVWIQTAYNDLKAPLVFQRDLFELVGPEDYTPDYVTEAQRLERSTLVRTVGHFLIRPILADTELVQRYNEVLFKAALFTAGDGEIDDGFATNPAQFDILDPLTFTLFCRDHSPLKIFWSMGFRLARDGGADWGDYWWPPAETGNREWDVTVKRRMKGDEGLWLLVNAVSVVNGPAEQEFGYNIDVESRNLLND